MLAAAAFAALAAAVAWAMTTPGSTGRHMLLLSVGLVAVAGGAAAAAAVAYDVAAASIVSHLDMLPWQGGRG